MNTIHIQSTETQPNSNQKHPHAWVLQWHLLDPNHSVNDFASSAGIKQIARITLDSLWSLENLAEVRWSSKELSEFRKFRWRKKKINTDQQGSNNIFGKSSFYPKLSPTMKVFKKNEQNQKGLKVFWRESDFWLDFYCWWISGGNLVCE